MAVHSTKAHYKIVEIQPQHFQTLADQNPDAEAWAAMIELASRVEGALQPGACLVRPQLGARVESASFRRTGTWSRQVVVPLQLAARECGRSLLRSRDAPARGDDSVRVSEQ